MKDQDGTQQSRIFRFFNEIAILAQLSGAAFERVMPEGMTLPQFAVLNHMVRLGDARTPLELARAMQVTKGAMTNTLQHLEGKRFVLIKPDERDGRSKRVMLTDAGRAAREHCIAAIEPELAAIASAVPAERLAGIVPVLEEVRRFLDARRV